jgi:hypothetical protein
MWDTKVIEFRCEVYGVKMTTAGDWMVTVKVPHSNSTAIQELAGVTGLNLRATMVSEGTTD